MSFDNNTTMYVGTFPKLTYVPTHFYKFIMAYKHKTRNNNSNASDNDIISFGAFLVPNTSNISPNNLNSFTPKHFMIRIRDLEALLGYKLVPEELSENLGSFLDNCECNINSINNSNNKKSGNNTKNVNGSQAEECNLCRFEL